ncbi:MAG: hypothetical protein IT365_21345 [Candidatus Hydrogenedentes bacterium]|nr:hypothetical protein [Candidatus Hydrogenedentota bacterium]
MLTSGKRLEFEGDVLAQIYTPSDLRPRVRARRRTFRTFLAALVITVSVALGGGMLVQSGFFSADRRAITRTAETLLTGMASGDMALATSVCAESSEGTRRLANEEGNAFRQVVPAASNQEALEARRNTLHAIRSELEQAGVAWSDVRPVAFGGIRGRVIDEAAMQKPITVVAGTLYFASAGRLYALEFTAWRCEGAYVITDVWQGSPVTGGPGELKALSQGQFDAFLQEPPDAGVSLGIEYPKHIFFTL